MPQRIRRKRLSTVTIHNCEQGTPEWHELRKGRVTASNAWKLLTEGYKAATEQKKIPQTKAMHRGTVLEPEAIELYEKIKGNPDVLRVGFVTNSRYRNAGASPDGVLADRLIEVKCFGQDKHLAIEPGNVPGEVIAQVQMQMMICELPLCDLVLYNPDLEPEQAFKIITIEEDKGIQDNIERRLKPDLHFCFQ